jgi:hypothetical protein
MVDARKSQIFDGIDRRQVACPPLGVGRLEPSVADGIEQRSQSLNRVRGRYVMAGHSWWFDSVRNAHLELRVARRHTLPIL